MINWQRYLLCPKLCITQGDQKAKDVTSSFSYYYNYFSLQIIVQL